MIKSTKITGVGNVTQGKDEKGIKDFSQTAHCKQTTWTAMH
jgi:hypothetical protein